MKRIIVGCVLLFFAFGFLFAETVNTGPTTVASPGVLFEIVANGEMALALCFEKTPNTFNEVLFKGPSGIKIRATYKKDENAMGFTTEFSHVGGHSSFKVFMNMIFYEQNLPIPGIYTVNGVVIAGIGDGGEREREMQIAVKKEYNKLPNDFQQGLRELYSYGAKSNIGLMTLVAPLRFIIGDQVEPFHVDQLIDRDPLAAQALQMEFNCN